MNEPPPNPTSPAVARYAGARKVVRLLVVAGAFVLLLSLLAFFLQGKAGIEKTLTRLLMPYGFMWLLLSAWIVDCWLAGKWNASLCTLGLWLLMTVCGSRAVANQLTRYLEGPFLDQDWQEIDPIDVLVVLGGGTEAGPHRAQAGTSGDRVLFGAQLYFADKTELLVTTGEALPDLRGRAQSGGAVQTVEIWTGLGIPREDIVMLPGTNTYQEIEALAFEMEGRLAGKRIGLLTSATHLPRALRLCASRGIEVRPIAADFRSQPEIDLFADFIPGSSALDQFSRCQKELMARLVGR